MRKLIHLFLVFGIAAFSATTFARSVEWNLNRYEPHYIKIKTALEEENLEKVKDGAKFLVAATRSEPDYGSTESDILSIEKCGRNILSTKTLDQASKEFASFTKVIERWKLGK